ncbi:MAG: deoxyribodipyrimidine photo-lyase [Cyanobacteria bacterium J06626_6]
MSLNYLIGDLLDRVVVANEKSLLADSDYVLVVLNRALRCENNPVVEAAQCHANALDVPLVVYCETDATATYSSDRLVYFVLGAFRELAIALSKQSIPCIQTFRQADDQQNLLELLIARAAAIYTDEDYTAWDRARLQRVQDLAQQTVFLVDAARLVPTRQIAKNIKTTPTFRKAHSALREKYVGLRQVTLESSAIAPHSSSSPFDLPTHHNFADYTDADLLSLLTAADINHDIPISTEHPPTQAEIKRRIDILKTEILARYKWIRNNAALPHSTSQLSPYLHFGMVGPHQVLAEIEAADVPKTYTWKFRDEFLTWREWSHYQAFHTPNLHRFEALPDRARETLQAHADDPRPELCTAEEIFYGSTPDATWNAAQREWLATGWLHNNLRMYWAKQLLRFTPDPEAAWQLACKLNDAVSLDGQDPATYASLQWAFGAAKPGYSEKPIYGWVAPKSDRAILKRKGMPEWIAARQSSQR